MWKMLLISALDFFLPTLADHPKPASKLAGQCPKSRNDRTLAGKFTARLSKTQIGHPLQEPADFGLWP
ncbi:hypothetical protein TNCT_330851 [Trichonephila clavata]|uniref:Secreted protein n=1 Tax=Trichonephila clavata TaxID=2740835 RepID=A0A8X6EWS2_TRICU|nr:hypothetical protein TNCT_330851 [Trichonephila clavata]